MALRSKHFLLTTHIERLDVQGLKCYYCPQQRTSLTSNTDGNGGDHKPVGVILPCTGKHRGIIIECDSHPNDDNTTSNYPNSHIPHGCIVGKKGTGNA